MKQIYLAGPDVFLPDAAAHFERLIERCAAVGLRGVQPSDGGMGSGAGDAALAKRILDANLALIAACDGLLANLQPFRNPLEPDSGTVFELGYAIALGKPVAGWLPAPHRPYEQRVAEHCGCTVDPAGRVLDVAHGFLVESFGQPLNLMLACSTRSMRPSTRRSRIWQRGWSRRCRPVPDRSDGRLSAACSAFLAHIQETTSRSAQESTCTFLRSTRWVISIRLSFSPRMRRASRPFAYNEGDSP